MPLVWYRSKPELTRQLAYAIHEVRSLITFADSAFKHGYGEDDFLEVLESKPMKLRSRKGLKGIYELLGQNATGDYIHAAYRKEGEQFTVFHMRSMTGRERRRYKEQR